MRSAFVDLVETQRKSIHQSIHPTIYKQSLDHQPDRVVTSLDTIQNGHNDTNNIDDSINKDESPSGIETDHSWKQRVEAGQLEIAPKQIDETITLDTQNDSHIVKRNINSHHILQNFVELGTMAKEISQGRMEAPASHEKVVVGIIVVWFIFISCIQFIPMGEEQQIFVIGILVNVNMSFFYGAPLSIICKVIKTKDSSWIHRQTMLMNTLCAIFFLAFGVGRMDYFLIVPNGIGVILGGLQLFLRLVIPSSSKQSTTDKSRPVQQEVLAQNPFNHCVHNGEHANDCSADSMAIRRTSELSA